MLSPVDVAAFHGYGHFHSFHGGAGIMFGGHLLKFGLMAAAGFAAMAVAIGWLQDWLNERYPGNNFRYIAGWVVFFATVLILGLLLARVI